MSLERLKKRCEELLRQGRLIYTNFGNIVPTLFVVKGYDLVLSGKFTPTAAEARTYLGLIKQKYPKSNVSKQADDLDKALDEMNAIAGRRLIERMAQDPEQLRGYLNLMFIARHLERVGDHATNIAEDAVYAVAAEDIRHQQVAAPA